MATAFSQKDLEAVGEAVTAFLITNDREAGRAALEMLNKDQLSEVKLACNEIRVVAHQVWNDKRKKGAV